MLKRGKKKKTHETKGEGERECFTNAARSRASCVVSSPVSGELEAWQEGSLSEHGRVFGSGGSEKKETGREGRRRVKAQREGRTF